MFEISVLFVCVIHVQPLFAFRLSNQLATSMCHEIDHAVVFGFFLQWAYFSKWCGLGDKGSIC